MSNRLLQAEFESVLKPFLGRYSSFHFFWKGRVALYAFLRAMGIGPGDEVILPAYTCVVVPSAILYTGATPVYVDINPDTYCCDPEAIERSITPRTKAILVQNTYGLSWKVDEIAQMGSDRNIVTIEDCTHGFGGMYDGVPNGSRCDASFFSSQWNKPFSTGLGGYLQVNRAEFTEKMAAIEVSNPGRIQELELAVQLALKKRLLTDKTYWKLRSIYRLLSRFNILRGSSQGSELSRLEMPVDFLQGMTDIQFKSGILAMGEFPRVQVMRRLQGRLIQALLMSKRKMIVPEDAVPNHGFLLYPIRSLDRAALFERAENARVRLVDWFTSPLHPVDYGLALWRFEPDRYPNAVTAARTTCGIPVHDDPDKVLRFLSENKDLIL